MRKLSLDYFSQFLYEVLWKSDTLFMEFWMSLYTLTSGVLFITDQIGSYYTGSSYSIVSYYVPQFWWGFILICFGLLELAGMYGNSYRFQKFMLMAGTGFWAFTAAIVGFGNQQTWIFMNLIFIAVIHIWLYLRVSRKLRIRNEVKESLP